jgi:hypothetical protein
MRPLFTIHAGEFLVGEYLEKNYPRLNVWIPSKDTGVDLLVTNAANNKSISFQVKLSRVYRSYHSEDPFESTLSAGGWFTLNQDKIAKSNADYWVFILVSHDKKIKPIHIVISPKELLTRLTSIHGKSERYNFYAWVKTPGLALDGRGLSKADKQKLLDGDLNLGKRDYSEFLEGWDPIKKLGV